MIKCELCEKAAVYVLYRDKKKKIKDGKKSFIDWITITKGYCEEHHKQYNRELKKWGHKS